jgi:hypothetical protein
MHVFWNELFYPFILGWASMGPENGEGLYEEHWRYSQ